MDVRVGLYKKLSTKELMLLNCGVGEDSWEFLGLQGEQTSQFWRRSVLNIHWKDWCWSWSSNALATWCKELTHLKRPDAGKDWGQEEKGMTEDEMVGWHHQLNGHEFEQALGDGEGQGSLACCSPGGLKESDMIKQLNNNNKSLWDLIPQPGIKPMPPHWKHVVLATGPPWKSLS